MEVIKVLFLLCIRMILLFIWKPGEEIGLLYCFQGAGFLYIFIFICLNEYMFLNMER